MSNKKWVIFDFDGTLSDAEHRQHFLRKEPQDWDGFFAEAHADPKIEAITDLLKVLYADKSYNIAIFTGRPERIKKMSEEWLEKHGLPAVPIYCRKDDDERHDLVIKKSMYEDFVASGKEISFIIEDRNSVVKMWRDMGVVCLHCFDADF